MKASTTEPVQTATVIFSNDYKFRYDTQEFLASMYYRSDAYEFPKPATHELIRNAGLIVIHHTYEMDSYVHYILDSITARQKVVYVHQDKTPKESIMNHKRKPVAVHEKDSTLYLQITYNLASTKSERKGLLSRISRGLAWLIQIPRFA